jgi:ferredoxin
VIADEITKEERGGHGKKAWVLWHLRHTACRWPRSCVSSKSRLGFVRTEVGVIRIEVDTTKCAQHGQCVLEAPGVFQLADSETVEWKATAEASDRADVERAVDVCPMQAISIRD